MLEVDIARYLTHVEDLEYKICLDPSDPRLEEYYKKLELYRRLVDRLRSLDEEIIGGMLAMVYECPQCQNEEHSPNANYCRICGLKIQKEESITKVETFNDRLDAASQECSRARVEIISRNFKEKFGG
jgi:transcription elongation factor Elf1